MSDRVCMDLRSYCGEGYVCGSDNSCSPSPELLASMRAKQESERAERREIERKEELARKALAEARQKAIADSIHAARLRHANPYQTRNANFARAEPACGSDISGLPGGDGQRRVCPPKKNLPISYTSSKGAEQPCTVPDAASVRNFSNWLPWQRQPPQLIEPCIKIPGWTAERPYNHSEKPVSVVVYNRGAPTVLVVPGATASKKFGLWAGPDNVIQIKEWDGTGTEVNLHGRSGKAGCSHLNMQGWPSPDCQQYRDSEQLGAALRELRAKARTERACLAQNGQILRPNQGAITETQCLARGGANLTVPDAESVYGWPTDTRGCYFKERIGKDQWVRLQDATLPDRQCKIVETRDDRRVQYFRIIDDFEEYEIIKGFMIPGKLDP